jgi:hypothetical protein
VELLTVNLAGKARRASLDGRPHLAVDMVLIVPGVLNGSRGPLLYPPEELRKDPSAWNAMPLVVNHPSVNGSPVSARRPEVLEKSGVGTVFGARVDDGGRLVAEGWFDTEKTRRVEPGVLASLEAGRPVELSTGLFLDDEPAPEGAVFNAPGGPRPYVAVARNLKPDHLAVLPGAKGACSIADGCGVLVNEEGRTVLVEEDDGRVLEYRLGEPVGDVTPELEAALAEPDAPAGNARKPSAGLDVSVEKACLILKEGQIRGKPLTPRQRGLFGVICGRRGKRKMAGNEGATDPPPADPAAPDANTGDDFQTVIERIFNAPPPAEGTPDSGDLMALRLNDADRDRIIKELVGNCGCHQVEVPWKGQDAAALNRLDDVQLNTMYRCHQALTQMRAQGASGGSVATGPAPAPQPAPQAVANVDKSGKPTLTPPPPPVAPGPPPRPRTVEEWLGQMPAEAQPIWNSVVEVHNREKGLLIEQIVGNVGGEARERLVARLQSKDLEELRDMLALAPPREEPARQPTANWFGAAAAPVGQPPVQEEPLGSPVYNFDRRSA